MMTKEDFEAFAEALAETRPARTVPGTAGEQASPYWQQWEDDREAIMDVLAASNPRFDAVRFIRATEV